MVPLAPCEQYHCQFCCANSSEQFRTAINVRLTANWASHKLKSDSHTTLLFSVLSFTTISNFNAQSPINYVHIAIAKNSNSMMNRYVASLLQLYARNSLLNFTFFSASRIFISSDWKAQIRADTSPTLKSHR